MDVVPMAIKVMGERVWQSWQVSKQAQRLRN